MALPIMASGTSPAPKIIPTEIDQNKKAISMGSFMAVLNLTIDSAPTIPKDNTTFDVTAKMTRVVIIDIERSDIPNAAEYITPL